MRNKEGKRITEDGEGPNKWKARVVGISVVLGTATFTGVVLIPRIQPEWLRNAGFSFFVVLITFAIVLVVAFVFRTLLDLQKVSIKRSSKEYIGELLEGVFTYRFDPERGGFYYGQVRNVVARVGTFQRLVKGLISGKAETERNKLLHKVGYDVGFTFAEVLKGEVLPAEGIRNDVLSKEMLQLWYDYDYRAGFATFDFNEFDPVSVKGIIRIRGHVLNYQRTNEKPVMCPFFHGYVEGVISFFSAHKIKLVTNCMQGNHTVCQIKISPVT